MITLQKRLKAAWYLALALLRTLLRRVFLRHRSGLAMFRANYADDGLAPLTAEQREAMSGFGKCVACGLCDRGEAERIAQSNGAYSGVMLLMLSASRSMPDFAAAARGFACVPDDALAEKERLCPARVPMRRIAAFVREKSSEARVSQPPPSIR
jgi:hypothetical protein